jgi:hypothetical protein
VNVTLGGEEAIVAGARFCEGNRNKIRLWKVISMSENVGEGKGIGSEETIAADEATVGESVTIELYPVAKDVILFFVYQLSEVSNEERGRRRRRKKAERGTKTGDEDKKERPEKIEERKGEEEEEIRGEGK